MNLMKSIRGLALACLCLGAVFAFGVAGSASAATLLFVPHTKGFPYHLVGTGGASELESLIGTKITSSESDILIQVLSATLADNNITFLHVKLGSEECQNAGAGTETVKTGLLLSHLGFADHEGKERPASLLLIGKIHFFCNVPLIGKELILVRGSIIGEITSPALGVASELLTVKYAQKKGVQLLESILFGSTTVAGQHQESSFAEGAFEQSAQSGEGTVHALPGQGTFLLVSP